MGLKFNPKELLGGSASPKNMLTPLWSNRSKDEWSKFLKGDYKTKDYLSPGGVLANPAQQIADPGNYLTTDEHTKFRKEGKLSDRHWAGMAVAGLIAGGGYLAAGGAAGGGGAAAGGGGAAAGGGGAAAGGSAAGGGTAAGGAAAGGGGAAAAGGAEAGAAGGAASSPWWKTLLGSSAFTDGMGQMGQEMQQPGPEAPVPNVSTNQELLDILKMLSEKDKESELGGLGEPIMPMQQMPEEQSNIFF